MADALGGAGHQVWPAPTALAALRRLDGGRPDAVIVEFELADLDPATAVRTMRAVSAAPVLVLSGPLAEDQVIRLLAAGADQVLARPFSVRHFLARLQAILRRPPPVDENDPGSTIAVGPLVVDLVGRSATLDATPLVLTRKEFDLLAYLAVRTGQTVTRRELAEAVWRHDGESCERTVYVHLSWLRRKLGETAARPRLLVTVHRVGVKLVDPTTRIRLFDEVARDVAANQRWS
ncbi:DNA-binding response regulator [Longispora fulva]|nr:DNA-binding response regulator [Longispora fulva]